jgi:microcystin-dependent protein
LFLCTEELTEIERWSFGETELNTSQQDDIEALTAKAYTELMTNPLLGTIFPYATTNPPPGSLACDGAGYLRVDYPQLYAALDSAFIVDADNFLVPDLQGRTIIGVGTGSGLTARAANDTGGEESHVLITAELAAHAHGVTDPTHSHTEGIAIPAVGAALVGVPIPSAVPGLGVTGFSGTGLTVNAAGSDTAHENMPPFVALGYAIWAD